MYLKPDPKQPCGSGGPRNRPRKRPWNWPTETMGEVVEVRPDSKQDNYHRRATVESTGLNLAARWPGWLRWSAGAQRLQAEKVAWLARQSGLQARHPNRPGRPLPGPDWSIPRCPRATIPCGFTHVRSQTLPNSLVVLGFLVDLLPPQLPTDDENHQRIRQATSRRRKPPTHDE